MILVMQFSGGAATTTRGPMGYWFFCSLSGLLCQIYYFFFEISFVHNKEARENPVFLSPQATLVPDPFGSFSYKVYLCFATTSQVKSKWFLHFL